MTLNEIDLLKLFWENVGTSTTFGGANLKDLIGLECIVKLPKEEFLTGKITDFTNDFTILLLKPDNMDSAKERLNVKFNGMHDMRINANRDLIEVPFHQRNIRGIFIPNLSINIVSIFKIPCYDTYYGRKINSVEPEREKETNLSYFQRSFVTIAIPLSEFSEDDIELLDDVAFKHTNATLCISDKDKMDFLCRNEFTILFLKYLDNKIAEVINTEKSGSKVKKVRALNVNEILTYGKVFQSSNTRQAQKKLEAFIDDIYSETNIDYNCYRDIQIYSFRIYRDGNDIATDATVSYILRVIGKKDKDGKPIVIKTGPEMTTKNGNKDFTRRVYTVNAKDDVDLYTDMIYKLTLNSKLSYHTLLKFMIHYTKLYGTKCIDGRSDSDIIDFYNGLGLILPSDANKTTNSIQITGKTID